MMQVASAVPEGIDWMSSGLGSMARERPSSSSSTRMEKLLGTAPASQPALLEPRHLEELIEEDIWGDGLPAAEARKEEAFTTRAREKEPLIEAPRSSSSDYRRRLGVERESGLSLAFGEPGRARGFASFAPVMNRVGASCREGGTPGRQPTASRMIKQVGMGSAAGYEVGRELPQSAPVEVPDWSKIVGDGRGKLKGGGGGGGKEEEEEDEDGERLPPHELLAREAARSQMTSFSVFEGVGRKLKGRDLSRVRSAVWRQTGFLE